MERIEGSPTFVMAKKAYLVPTWQTNTFGKDMLLICLAQTTGQITAQNNLLTETILFFSSLDCLAYIIGKTSCSLPK